MSRVIENYEHTRELTTVCARSGGRWKMTPTGGPRGPPVSSAVSRRRHNSLGEGSGARLKTTFDRWVLCPPINDSEGRQQREGIIGGKTLSHKGNNIWREGRRLRRGTVHGLLLDQNSNGMGQAWKMACGLFIF